MDAGTHTIERIFGAPQRFVIPLFQRPYVWKRSEQLEPLWEDIRRVADRLLAGQEVRPHFLGAIVLEQLPSPVGYLQSRLVIDGQQRLTTIQIVLEAFSDVCTDRGIGRFDRVLLQLTRNDSQLCRDEDDRFKVWPTNVDRESFRHIMEAGSPRELGDSHPGLLKPSEAGHAIADAYCYFYEAIAEWLEPDGDGVDRRVEALFATLYRHIRVVGIDLGREDDPQMIFETLNARGTPLLPSDLVKNYLFHRASEEGQPLEPLYKDYWEQFDTNANYWRSEVGRGHAKRARIDLFLHHYLTLRIQDEVSVGQLYTAFCAFVKEESPAGSAADHLKALQEYARLFHRLELMPLDTPERRFVDRLNDMETVTAYPFLLELFARFSDQPAELLAILMDLESFLVRRMICQNNTRGYGRLFIDMLRALMSSDGSPHARIRTFLLESDAETRRWPDDRQFHDAWVSLPIYRLFVQRRTRMILWALELGLHTDMGEKISMGGKLSMEHILPQEWKEERWPLPTETGREDAVARREQLVHTIGNLTLVTPKLDSSLSNSGWATKRQSLDAHAILRLNHDLTKLDTWDEDRIVARTEALFEVAKRIWPRPA